MLIALLISANSFSMKILQLNCSGLTKDLSKQLSRYVDDKHIEVVCLQETFAKDRSTSSKNWRPYLNPSSDGYGGVAIFVSPSVKSVPYEELKDPRLEAVWTRIQVAGKVTILGSVYIRPGQLGKVAILQNIISGINNHDQIIVNGDLNGHSQQWDSNFTQTKLDPARKIGVQIENLILQENLKLHNTGQYTFIHRRDGGKWALDLFLTRNIHVPTRWQSDHLTSLKSDHCPTILSVEEERDSYRKTKWDLKNTSWDIWSETIERAVASIISDESFLSKTPDEKCHVVQDLLKQRAEDVIPKKLVCEHSRAFFSKKLSDLHKEFRIDKKRFDFRSDEHNQNKLDQLRDKLNAEYEKESDNFWKEICQNTSTRDIWNTIKKITNQQKHIILQPLRNSDGSFEFDDENIASRLKSAHVVKDNIDTSRFI